MALNKASVWRIDNCLQMEREYRLQDHGQHLAVKSEQTVWKENYLPQSNSLPYLFSLL